MLWQEEFVVDVVDHKGTDSGLGVYRKEVREGNIINNRAIKASQSVTRQYAVLSVPNAVVGDTGEGRTHSGKYSRCFAFLDR